MKVYGPRLLLIWVGLWLAGVALGGAVACAAYLLGLLTMRCFA